MGQLENAVTLYRLMAERCEKNGFSPEQAKIYAEMSDFTGKCSDIEDATRQIKKSKYYLAPTEALVRDRIAAQIRAAKENNMPEVVKVYEDKLAAIDSDQGEMYTAGYETSAQNIKKDYILTIQAFAELFRCYVCFVSDGNQSYLGEIKTNLSRLKKPSSDFVALSANPAFRTLADCTDEGYKLFVEAIEQVRRGETPKTNRERYIFPEGDANSAWDEVKAYKDEIIAAGRGKKEVANYGNVIVIAPTVQEYEAAKLSGEKATYTYEEVTR